MNQKQMIKPIAAGLITASIATYFYGGGSIPIMGINVPVVVPLATAGFIGSIASEVSHDYIFPNIQADDKFNNLESAAVGALVSGVGGALFLKVLTDLPMESIPTTTLIGAGGFIASEYLVENLLTESKSGELIF